MRLHRVLAGYHFYTDVLVVAGAGLPVGTAVSVLHLHRGVHGSAFRPEQGEGMGIAIGGTL